MPVTYVELSEAEESLALATLDPLSAMAYADKQKLDELLRQTETGDAALQEMIAKLAADSGVTKFDPMAEWEGMPEYGPGEEKGNREIILHFATEEDVQEFASIIGQAITEKTKWLWHPKREAVKRQGIDSYKDES